MIILPQTCLACPLRRGEQAGSHRLKDLYFLQKLKGIISTGRCNLDLRPLE
jgi:hypothetical protein